MNLIYIIIIVVILPLILFGLRSLFLQNFSKSIKKMNLHTKKKIVIAGTIFIILFFVGLHFFYKSGTTVVQKYNINNIYQSNFNGERLFIFTEDGPKFTVDIYTGTTIPVAIKLGDALSKNKNLLQNVEITYRARLNGYFKNVTGIKLSDGEFFDFKEND